MEALNDIYEYAYVIYTRMRQANVLQRLKHLNIDNVVAVRKNNPIYSNNVYIGYGDITFFNVYTKRYVNLQANEYEEIMLMYFLTQFIIKNFAVFMCVDKIYFDYAKNVIIFFEKHNYVNYAFLQKADAQTLDEYKQMLLNYAKLMHKTYVYSKHVDKETLLKLRINCERLIKYENITQNVLIDYYIFYFMQNKQNLKLLSFLSKRKQKAFKSKLRKRLQKIQNVRVKNKYLATAVKITEDDLCNYFFGKKANETERLQLLAACVVLHGKVKDSRAKG